LPHEYLPRSRYMSYIKTRFTHLIWILVILTASCQLKSEPPKETKATAKQAFDKLKKEKDHKDTDLEFIKKEGIIKTDVVATNPSTQVEVRDFNVNISQIDNSKFPEVTLLVSVTDKKGNPLKVNPDFFTIEENGFPVPKKNFVSVILKKDSKKKIAKKPLSILLAIDKSGSMKGNAKKKEDQPMSYAKNAAVEFIKQAKESDLIKVIAFDGDIHPLGANERAVPRIEQLQPTGSTALYGVLLGAVKELQMGGGIKAVILLTDGRNDTRGTINQSLKSITLQMGLIAADQLAIPVFTIGFGERADVSTLETIAKRTHALFFKTAKKEEITQLYTLIREIINTQYLITYRSESLQEVTDVKVELGRFVDRREFSTPAHVVKREKKLREDIRIVKDRESELNKLEGELSTKQTTLSKREKNLEERNARLKEERIKVERDKLSLEKKEAELKDFEGRMTQLKSKLDVEEKALAKLRQELTGRQASLDEEEGRVKELSRANSTRAASLERKGEALAASQKRLEKQLEDLRVSRAKLNELQISLENKEARLKRELTENTELNAALKKQKLAVDTEKKNIDQLRKKLNKLLKKVKDKYNDELKLIDGHKSELDTIQP